jgi:hypothetical protein
MERLASFKKLFGNLVVPVALILMAAMCGCDGDQSLKNYEASHPGPDVVRSVVGTVTDVSCVPDGQQELFTIGVQAANEQEAHAVHVYGPIAKIPPSGEVNWTIKRKSLKQDFWYVSPNQPLQDNDKHEPCPE